MSRRRRRSLRRLRRKAVPALRVLLALSVLWLVGAGVLAASVPGLRADLERARTHLLGVSTATAAGDVPAARRAARSARSAAADAHATTTNPLWRVYASMPGLRAPLTSVAAVASSAHGVATDVLPELLAVDVSSSAWRGRLELDPLRAAAPRLAKADRRLAELRRALAGSPSAGISQVDEARYDLGLALEQLHGGVVEVRAAADVLPALLGADRPTRLLLALQTNAEARATGGLLGAYGVLRADAGRLVLERVGSNDELPDAQVAPLDLGDEFRDRYGPFSADRVWRSANLTPDLPTAARIWTELWAARTGERLDGVVALDLAGMADLLRATGPLRLDDGRRIDADNAVPLLGSEVYRLFDGQNDDRNAYLQGAARALVRRLSEPGLSTRAVGRAVADAASGGHLQLWAADPSLQRRLKQSRAAGALSPVGPYLSVVTQDAGGSKLDYYLRRAVRYDARPTGTAIDLGAGPELEEEAVVTVRLHNTAPAAGLPAYVTARADEPDGAPRPRGQVKEWVTVYLGPRGTLLEARLDGRPILMSSTTDSGLVALSSFVTIDPGATRTLVLEVRQPAAPGSVLRWRQQPRLQPDELVVRRVGSERRPVAHVYPED